MESIQRVNFGINNAQKTEKLVFKLKPYIQPFERYLARAELYGLLGADCIKSPLSSPADSQITFSTSMPVEYLRKRLAYWEQIGTGGEFSPSLQVILESEEGIGAQNSGKPFHFHRSRKLRYGPHGIHEYRGKFFPQLVKSLINFAGLSTNKIVLDPMCGSGTANCEARSMGMKTLGVDLNPLSVKISKIKTSLFDINRQLLKEQVGHLLTSLKTIDLNNSNVIYPWNQRDFEYFKRWFSLQELKELAIILEIIKNCSYTPAKEFMEICLSNIIRTVSWQKDSDLRVRKEIKVHSSGTAVSLFSEELQKNLDKILSYLSCFDKDREFPEFNITEGDSRHVNTVLIKGVGECDLLITSPPYAMALPYIDTDRLSLSVLGILPRVEHRQRELLMIGNREVTEKQRQELWDQYLGRRNELPEGVRNIIEKIGSANHNGGVGFRKRNLPALLGKYFLDMTDAMYSAKQMMKSGSYGFYVVGNNSTMINKKRVEIQTDRLLWEIGKKVGWKQKKVINMELLPSRDIFRYQRGTSESILWFQA